MAQLSLKKIIAKLLDNKAMIDRFYPVGSYYETSDASFNPNTAWGGTWVLEAEGQVHIGAGSTYTIGDTGGEETHTLTVDEMPSHNHDGGILINNTVSGGARYYFPASSTTNGTNVSNSLIIGNTGGGQAHNNMQPYIVVNRWHRTA